MNMNAFLADNQCDISLNHWSSPAEMCFSHTHPQYEIYFCADNVEQKSVINGVEYRYKYPCVIISSPYTIHSMSCIDKNADRYERFVIYFDDNVISPFKNSFIPEGLLERNSGFMFKLSEDNAEYLKQFIINFNPQDKNEMMLLLVAFLKKLISLSPIEDAVCIGKSSFYIQDILQYISEHFAEDISADTLSYKFLISRSKLDRDFKKCTGITVHAFIDMCKINQAKMLLKLFPEMSVADVSCACGFSSETYFFPFFKKNVGITPIEFRKSIRDRQAESNSYI